MLKIYLDNCSYNRPFDSQLPIKIRLESEAKLYIQAGIRAQKYSLAWPYILDIENNANPYEEKRNAIAPWKDIADVYCPPSDEILAMGKKTRVWALSQKTHYISPVLYNLPVHTLLRQTAD